LFFDFFLDKLSPPMVCGGRTPLLPGIDSWVGTASLDQTDTPMKKLIATLSTLMMITSCASTRDPRSNYDTELEIPSYTVLRQKGNLEIRQYEPHIVATATVKGDYDTASRDGFKILGAYIFGDNQARTEIPMTAPVSSSIPANTSENISMTAPVGVTEESEGSWKISFTMPSNYNLDTLPKPTDPRVQFEERSSNKMAAAIFSGFTTEASLKNKEIQLVDWLREENLQYTEPVVIARYNAPFTLPWNRRNEILLQILEGPDSI
jgi:hypothetical protein